MIYVRKLGKRFGQKALFSEVDLELRPGQRYGLVGANGSGKTTFLKILTGDEAPDDGEISLGKNLRLGFLRQDQFAEDAAPIVEVAMRGDPHVFSALQELHQAETEHADVERIVHLTELVAREDGYTLESRAREILVGLGLPAERLDDPLGTLSGGYKLRVLLAQVLAGRPDILLLDEPTNHLDILSIRFLEQFLCASSGTAVIISHDRRFLDVVSTRILDVDYETITDYPGNYEDFARQKEERAEQQRIGIERQEKLLAEKKAFVERFRAKATKARQAQSRAKQIEKMEIEEVKRSSRRAPNFRFDVEQKSGTDVLRVEGLSKAYGEKTVLSNVSFSVRRAERVGIIGPNGIGKSTLLKILTDHVRADRGEFSLGASVRIGYFAQDHHELLGDPKLTPLDFVWNAAPGEAMSSVRGQLGRMLISGDEVEKSVTALSGGEAARVIFARLSVEKPNLLVLDEPTNHLDLESIEALAETLRSYAGTLLFVSHDRWFVSQIATRIIELRPDGYSDFPGTFSEYLERDGVDHLDVRFAPETTSKKREGAAPASKEELKEAATGEPADPRERRRLANRRKALPKKRDELLLEIDRLEAEKRDIEARYAAPEFYTKTSAEEQRAFYDRRQVLEERLAESLRAWEEIETELAELSS